MTNTMIPIPVASPDKEAPNPLVALLQSKGLLRVAIVDDCYDPPDHIQLSAQETEDLWGLLEFEDEALAELSQLGSPVSGPKDLTGPLLALFFDNRAQLPKFDALWQRSIVGQRREEQAAQLKRIEGCLTEKFDLTVGNFGKNASVEDLAHYDGQLLLLDWYLEEGGAAATEMAVRKAKEIYEQWPSEQTRPHIVLMSSKPNVRTHADDFRRASGLLAGMFHAIPKAELTDQFALQMHLHLIAMSLQAGHRIQAFVDTLRLKVKEVGEDFINGISALTLSDYAYIQSLSLQADGQPLGDYLVWLFSSYFGHLLFGRALQQQRNDLDALAFTTLPSQTVPSSQLAEMYLHALFDVDVGPVAPHPLAQPAPVNLAHDSNTPTNEAHTAAVAVDDQDLMLSLGDIFVPKCEPVPGVGHVDSEKNQAIAFDKCEVSKTPDLMMVINAQCDLAFAPDHTRSIERERSILLLPGTLQPIREPILDKYKDAPRTELYKDGDLSYRIFWNTKEVKTIPYGEFRRWHDGSDPSAGMIVRYERKARLRLPFALEVQRAFAADLTRVGMPVAPPIYQVTDIRLLRATEKKFDQEEKLEESEAAFLVLSRDGHKVTQQCVLTLPLVYRLNQMLNTNLTALENQLNAGVADDKMQKKLQARVEALRRAIANYAEWVKLLSPIEIPTSTKSKLFVAEYIQIVNNKSVGDDSTTDKVIAAVSLQ